jgi:O-antigen/teichoic acid export membrane protein
LPAFPALLILLVGYGFANIFNWNRPLLLAMDQPGFPLVISLIVGVVSLGATFLWVPQHGYLMQAGILSAYFIVSITIILGRGLGEIRRMDKLDKMPIGDKIQL